MLVPRTKDQAGAMSDRLAVHGASAEEVPTIAVEPPRSPTQMERAVKGLVDGRYQWVVFTSTNAVRAVWEKFAEFGLDGPDTFTATYIFADRATAEVRKATSRRAARRVKRVAALPRKKLRKVEKRPQPRTRHVA